MTRRLVVRGAIVAGFVAAAAALLGEWLARPGASGWVVALTPVAAAAVGVAAGYLAFRHAGKTLAEVSAAANRFAGGELGLRVTETSGPTGELTRNFNNMARRVQDLFEAQAAEHARLEAVFEASTDAMVAVAADTGVRFLNAAAASLLGLSREQAIGRPFIESARDYELDALVRRAIATGTAATSVVTFGQQRLPLRAAAVAIAGGGDWAVLLMLTDLTEVQRIDQVRRDFLTNVSHELRTPLASIRALVETLENGDVEAEDVPEFMRRIRQQVHRLTLLVNELLDLSRIESGAVPLRPEEIDLGELVAETAGLLGPRMEGEAITVEGPPTPGLAIEADRGSLQRVVSNLLDNAIRFSPQGGTIRVEARDEGELVALSVRDQGPGIAAQDLPRVFERFYKADQSRTEGGTGLGLAIVRHLVRAHGGTVEAESPPEGGALFTVRLPRRFVGGRRAAGV